MFRIKGNKRDKEIIMKISKAIGSAKKFIFSHRNRQGLWEDFNSQSHGNGVDWISSYVGLSLLNAGVPLSDLKLTAYHISRRQDKGGGWGYNNKTSAPDADSTAFSILFLSRFDYGRKVRLAKEFLLQHQKGNGGFGTYLEELVRRDYQKRVSADTSVAGWCSAIPEITTMALKALKRNERALEYIKESQSKGGFWRSYWYNNNIYATTQGIRSLQNHGAEYEIKKAQEWLAKQNSIIPFYLALQIMGLVSNKRYRDKINYELSNLINMQRMDGSWENHSILRVPSPSNTKPWEDMSRWREDIRDQERIFTTATCLEALAKYEEEFPKPR